MKREVVQLESGDLVVLVSDGITDAIDASGPGIPTPSALSSLTCLKDAQAACAALLEAARRSPGPTGVTGWADDRTVVAFGVSPPPLLH
jgi:serine phosphatase RsbU (regulator of sigma subunit)